MADDCIFCHLHDHRPFVINDRTMVIPDGIPLQEGHALVIPRRHVADLFDLRDGEWMEMLDSMKLAREKLMDEDPTIEGFNVGINAGEVAGQSVMHCHVHLIPRRAGDVSNPRGGIRRMFGEDSYSDGTWTPKRMAGTR